MEFDEWKEKWMFGKYIGEYILWLKDVDVRCPKESMIVQGKLYENVEIFIEGIIDDDTTPLTSESVDKAMEELRKKFGNACWEMYVDRTYEGKQRIIMQIYAGYR